MTRRVNKLMIIALGVIVGTLYFGCSQPEDILTPVAFTDLNLNVQMLPTAPDGMVYELWLTKDGDTVSIGKFNYDPANKKVLDVNGQPRADGSRFVFDGDIFAYDSMLVSVEVYPDPDSASTGPIMLVDKITNPDDNPIELRFPLSDSLWYGILDFCMVTVSDKDMNSDRTVNLGAGVWFASYQFREIFLVDTIGIDTASFEVYDSTWWPDTLPDGETLSIPVVGLDSFKIDTVKMIYGFDTVAHIAPVLFLKKDTFTEPPFLTTKIRYSVDTTLPVQIQWDNFIQAGTGLPDYSIYGWKYKGWVVSPAVKAAGASIGKMTLPPWDFSSMYDGIDGGIITTGVFTTINPTDDPPLYTQSDRIPPYPGDEFLQNLPNGAAGPLNLLPNENGNTGTVFITLEPDNFVTDTTNFPLIVLARNIPSSRSEPNFNIAGPSDTVTYQLTMHNHTNTNDPFWGFPKITVSVSQH